MWWILPVLCSPVQGADLFEGRAFYYGDLHSHTGISGDGASSDMGVGEGNEACGPLEDYVLLAREAGLDFVAMTDHVDGPWVPEDGLFERGLEIMLEGNEPGVFLTLPGAEVGLSLGDGRDLGHKTLLLFGEDALLEELTLDDARPAGDDFLVESCGTVWTWAEALQVRFGPALLVPHHPAAVRPMGTDWSCHSATWSPVVEVYSDHGSSIGGGLDFDPLWGGTRPEGTVHAALELHEHQLGFVGGTDRHDTHPGAVCQLDSWVTQAPYGGGLTVAVLDKDASFDRVNLYEAMRSRSTYATSGPMIPAALDWSSAGAELGDLGDDVGLPAGQPLRVDLRVPEEWALAVREVVAVTPDQEVVLDPAGTGAWRTELLEEVPWAYLRVEVDGEVVYGQGGCEDGGEDATEYLWMSPAWFHEVEGDLDGDGHTWAAGDCHDGDPAVHPEAQEQCRNEVDDDCDGLLDGLDPECAAQVDENAVPSGPEGQSLPPPERPPEGCSHGTGAAWWLWLPLLALRRRG